MDGSNPWPTQPVIAPRSSSGMGSAQSQSSYGAAEMISAPIRPLKFSFELPLKYLVSNDTMPSDWENGSSDELDSATALEVARKALDDKGDFRYGNVRKLEAEFFELGLYTPSERFAAVDIALSEIKPGDRCGPRPPGNVSFPPYRGRPLYAFKWKSSESGLFMYLKFCLAGTTGMELLVLYSFHEDRS